MKKFVHPVRPSSEISGFQETVLQDKNPESRSRRLFKALNSIQEEDDIVNKYKVTRLGDDFKIVFNDGRKLIWDSNNLPIDWLDVLWEYGTTSKQVLPVGYRMDGEPGGLFDSSASTTVR